jgi:hypothetical protein
MRGSTVKRGRTWSYVFYLGRHSTGQKWVGGFDTRRAAEDALVAALGKRRDGIAIDAGRMTVGQYLDEWLTGITPSLRPTTAPSYRKLMRGSRAVGRGVGITAPAQAGARVDGASGTFGLQREFVPRTGVIGSSRTSRRGRPRAPRPRRPTNSPVLASRAAKSSMYCTWAEISSGVYWSIGTSFTDAGAPR